MTMTVSDNLATTLYQFRGAFYMLLSRAFSRELDQDAVKGMEQVSKSLMEIWEILRIPSNPDVQAGKTLLESFFAELGQESADEEVERLAAEYASLFLGVGSKTVSPCESVYRSNSGMLYQSALFEVQRVYSESGMAKNDQYSESDDHISVELMYMAGLCEMTQEAGKTDKRQALQCLGLQQKFLQDHLLQWVPRFSHDLIDTAPPGFYRAMAYLLKGYTQIDSSLIELTVQELNQKQIVKKGRKKTTSNRS